ncbi:UNVERIFIED_CONTAM: hypothetical protein EX528_11710 [Xanthomonas axonopodis]
MASVLLPMALSARCVETAHLYASKMMPKSPRLQHDDVSRTRSTSAIAGVTAMLFFLAHSWSM